jgi:uncharacterized damage-inducible protein DinB
MLRDVLIELYERDFGRLREEIEQYPDDESLWRISDAITNSGGNLCLHITGGLKHFFGAVLGGTNYVRDRDAEFSDKGVSREQLLSDIQSTFPVVKSTLEKLTQEDFAKTYPIEVFGQAMTTEFFLTHLTTHFNYHLGQINYHRRLLSRS